MKNKVVVTTGASSGIGAALSELIGGKGARPILVARREKELRAVAARCGPEALSLVADVTRREEVEGVVRAALSRFGQIDVWVNNAGWGITRAVSELTDDDVDEMMRVNFKSALYGMQAVLPHFKRRGRGHIINVSSVLGRVPLVPARSAYGAAKHALNALTASLRMELRGPYPAIVVSSVHPGVVATDFGCKAKHGGVDSRRIPGAQPAEEVANVIAGLMENPRADVYTHPGAQQLVVAYFAADDMGRAEQEPPFAAAGPPRP